MTGVAVMDNEIESVSDIVSRAESCGDSVSVKNMRGTYTYASDGWGRLATVPAHEIVGRSDDRLPWEPQSGDFIRTMDIATVKEGYLEQVDRRVHFQKRAWAYTATKRMHVRQENAIVCVVSLSHADPFCRLAGDVTEHGISFNGVSFSVKQLYLLNQLLFRVPQKETARELGCSSSHVSKSIRRICDDIAVANREEMFRELSVRGLLPLLERFDLLFSQQWLPSALKYE
jgi:DNA-binding CsgD family transcriptional regulator